MKDRRDQLVDACRVPDSVKEGRSGLWEIRRFTMPDWSPNHGSQEMLRRFLGMGHYDSYTALLRDTMATLHCDMGEIVMEDSPRELRRHLPILLAAQGRVLISGLGLGCVLRGLLSKPEVKHVDVIEIDPAIAQLVWPEFEANPRTTLHMGDAETIEWAPGVRWDFIWHDVWSELEHLDVVHGRLLVRYEPHSPAQGAWQLHRPIKRVWPRPLLNARRRNSAPTTTETATSRSPEDSGHARISA